MPTLSIIIPAYNIEKYLPRCLESIIRQQCKDLEVIIIDDGSNDDTPTICDTYAERYDYIKVTHKHNSGVSAARNLGLKKAIGKYIMFVDGDDSLVEDSLTKAIAMAIHDNADISIFRCQTADTDYTPRGECFSFPQQATESSISGLELFCNHTYYRSSVWGALYKADFMKRHNTLFIENIANGEDGLFMACLYSKDPEVRFYDLMLYKVTERPGSATRSWDRKRFMLMAQTIPFLQDKLRQTSLNDYERSIISYRIYANVSLMFDTLVVTTSWRVRCDVVNKVRQLLRNYTIATPLINRQRTQIKMLNISVWLFFWAKWGITNIRRLK